MSKELDSLAESKHISFCVKRGESFVKANLFYKIEIPVSAYVTGLREYEFIGTSWEEAEKNATDYLNTIVAREYK